MPSSRGVARGAVRSLGEAAVGQQGFGQRGLASVLEDGPPFSIIFQLARLSGTTSAYRVGYVHHGSL